MLKTIIILVILRLETEICFENTNIELKYSISVGFGNPIYIQLSGGL